MWSQGPKMGKRQRYVRGSAGREGRKNRKVGAEAKPFWRRVTTLRALLQRRTRTLWRWFVCRPVRAWMTTGPFRGWFSRQQAPDTSGETGVMKQFPKERSWP